MKTGDKINYLGTEYTILEVEETVAHLITESGYGICVLLTELMK